MLHFKLFLTDATINLNQNRNMKFLTRNLLVFSVLLLGSTAFAQLTPEDYQRADSTRFLNDLVYHSAISANWIGETHNFWYQVKTRQGNEYFLVDAAQREKRQAFDQESLAGLLEEETGREQDAFDLSIRNISFDEELNHMEFISGQTRYRLDLEDYTLEEVEQVRNDRRGGGYWGSTDHELGSDPVISPDSQYVAFIREYNVYVRERGSNGEIYQLSFDGSEGEYYSGNLRWSPDSEFIAVNKIRPNTPRYMHFVESSPSDQLQPKLHKVEYLKPGDALQIRMPALFDVNGKRKVDFDTKEFEHQYRLSNPSWRDDSRAFTFEFNQRGHQVYQVVEVNRQGNVNILIDERSETFIDYSSKKYRSDIDDGREIIWASERDGWNHLYLFDGINGGVKNQITRGEWVVRGVDHVDEENRRIIFRGAGRHQGEDPYLVRYYRVNFDGSGLVELTPEEANHRATFSDDHEYFVNNYSRIDLPNTAVLRRTSDGQAIMTLEQEDITDLVDAGWQTPEVFVAKGRDGETDIWGNIYRPTNFNPEIDYPVIEAIYAGPHSAHVPKSFRPYFGHFSGLAELGFIIVQIDGMGTSHRSKEFHDVCWQNLKDAGFPDRILWMQAAAEQYNYMDIDRVGIFGGSAGGQNAMGALLFHPEFYKAAVASVGCHDNRMDKIWWNEQWMGYPIGPHYEESSNVVNAHKLEGNLLLTVGEMDTNVDPASTYQVVDALIDAGKDFEFMMFPGSGHGSGGQYGERRKRDFFIRHLLNKEVPDWNRVASE